MKNARILAMTAVALVASLSDARAQSGTYLYNFLAGVSVANPPYLSTDRIPVKRIGVSGILYIPGNAYVPLSGAAGQPSAIDLLFGTNMPLAGTTGTLPFNRLAVTGSPTGSKFVRDDGVLAVPAGGGGGSSTNGVSGDILRSDGASGFGTPLTPGANVAALLASFTSANLRAALTDEVGGGAAYFVGGALGTPASGSAANLTGMPLAGLASISSNTVVANVTGGSASPTPVALPACPDSGGQHLNYSSGVFSCGTTGDGAGSGTPVDVSDGTNIVTGVSSITFDPNVFAVSGSSGAANLTATSTVGADKSAVDYTLDPADANTIIPVGAGHTYTFAQAGSAGFGTGWGPCLQNVSASGNATITTTTSLFKGAGGATSFLLPAQAWACLTSKSGDWITQLGYGNTLPAAVYLSGTLTPTALSGNVNDYNPAGLSGAVALRIDGGAADRTITGLGGGVDGRLYIIMNVGATNNLIISNADAASTAANRFLVGANITMAPNANRLFRYDGTSSRFRPVGPSLADTGATPGSYTCMNATVDVAGRLTAAANGSCSGGSGITAAFAPIGWVAAIDPNKAVIMTATTSMTVTAIRGRVGDAVGAAATVTVNKAPSGTACSGGTAQHTGSFDANGTPNTNQTLTLAGGAANSLSVGDSLCLVTTGGANWTGGLGIGGLTIAYTVP